MTDFVTKSEAIRIAEQNASRDRSELLKRLPRTRAEALKRARSGKVRRGGSMTGGAAVGVALTPGLYRTLRHSPGVARLLWEIGEGIADDGSTSIPTHAQPGERHLVVDGKPSRPGNRKGSYRVAVITRTQAAKVHEHDSHILEAALTRAKR